MFEATYADAIFSYLVIWLLFLAILWRRETRRLKRHQWHISRTNLFHCDNCHLSFVPSEQLNLCRCPRCNTICIKRRHLGGTQ